MSFFELEEKKKKIIIVLFSFLISLYFLTFYLIWMAIKSSAYFSFPSPLETVFLIFLSIAVAYIHIRLSTENIFEKIISMLGAKPPDEEDYFHRQLKNVVDEILISAGGISAETYIVPTHSMNAFSISDLKGRNAVGVTEGLLSGLSRSQLQGVIAHEVSHIINNDSFLVTIASSLFSIYNLLLEKVSEAIRKTRVRYANLMIIFILLKIISFLSKLVNLIISREREYRADATAARLTRYPESLAEALYIISRHSYSLSPCVRNFENIFIINPAGRKLDEKKGIVANLFSTHPPVKDRISTLLDISHRNFSDMVKKIEMGKDVKKSIPYGSLPSLSDKIYYACSPQNEWIGPLSKKELILLPFFSPSLLIYNTLLKKGVHLVSDDKSLSTLSENIKDLCPSCHTNLNEDYYEGTKILKCSSCGGYFLDKEKLIRILSRKISDFSEDVKREGDIIRREIEKITYIPNAIKTPFTLSCPKCSTEMRRMFYSLVWPVEIDRCMKCMGIWIGKKELELIQYLFESETQHPRNYEMK